MTLRDIIIGITGGVAGVILIGTTLGVILLTQSSLQVLP